METSNSHGKCAHSPCNCKAGHESRFCSDHCEDHASRPVEDIGAAGVGGSCGCGHSECMDTTGAAAD